MTAVIITLVLVLVPALIGYFMAARGNSYGSDVTSGVLCFIAVAFIGGMLAMLYFIPLAGATGGFWPDYSTGTREGYITKVSVKGAFWKTNEAQIQVGTGEMAALQEPFSFSISDPAMAELVNSYLGDRVRIEYTQWLIQPYSLGETPYDCVSILPIND
jgi:hypothetical protein